MTFFSHRPFLRFSGLPYLTDCPSFLFLNSKFSQQTFLNDLFLPFHILQMMTPISYYLNIMHPLVLHTHMLVSRFCTLLCALVAVNTAYTIYFFLIHYCTNSLSSLHIFVHHCTFCASLHTKTSPATI